MTPIRILPLAALSVALTAACTPETPPEATPFTCRSGDATRLVGQVNPTEAAIKALTGAGTVRQLGPNQPMTMDYRFDRVTVIKDPATGRILRATCG